MNVRDAFFNEVSVLIVDDDIPSTQLMHILLAEQGAYVQTASTGKEALVRVANSRPHVIVTDIAMPDMDGWGLIHSLKSRAATADIPIIVISAFDSVEVRARASKLGCVDYLVKPIPSEAFVTHLIDALRNLPGFANDSAAD